jgi:hypothetical protein
MSTILVAGPSGPTPTDAFYRNAGLAVTRMLDVRTHWHVTHIASGLCLDGGFAHRHHAKRYQERLLGLGIDFTQEAAALRALPDLHTQLLNAMDGIPHR